MKFLLDTNIFIPLERMGDELQEGQEGASRVLFREVHASGNVVYLHPEALRDIARDPDSTRRQARKEAAERYPLLPEPPPISEEMEAELGTPEAGSNDWVDFHLISALLAEAADVLVTEDKKLRSRARRLGLSERVLSLQEAMSLVLGLQDKPPTPPPAVRATHAHAIHPSDPILDTFRSDYPGFDEWFVRCRREHRLTWIIETDGGRIAGFCIVNEEKDAVPGPLEGRVLKLCSFKIAEAFNGFRFGELLLRTVLEHAFENGYDWVFVTVFDKWAKLTELLEAFGFDQLQQTTTLGELILAKPLTPKPGDDQLSPLDYHIRYGPRHLRASVRWFLVPIQPRWSHLLFPDSADQQSLFLGQYPFGNAIRKAYLSHSKTELLKPGDGLLFYRSRESPGVIAAGVAEQTVRSSSADQILRSVARRTVYSHAEIIQLCRKPVLALLFRQARIFSPTIPLESLIERGLILRAPQSITQLAEEAPEWIVEKLEQ